MRSFVPGNDLALGLNLKKFGAGFHDASRVIQAAGDEIEAALPSTITAFG
jgi:hypothetical protein